MNIQDCDASWHICMHPLQEEIHFDTENKACKSYGQLEEIYN